MKETDFGKVWKLREDILYDSVCRIYLSNPCEQQNWRDKSIIRIMELINESGVLGGSVIPFCKSTWKTPPLFEQAENLFSVQVDELLQLPELSKNHENKLSCLFFIWFYYPFICSADSMRNLYVKIIENELFHNLI